MSMHNTSSHLRLHDLLARFKPFNTMQPAHLARLHLHKVVKARGTYLLPEPGHLYLVLSGRSLQIDKGHAERFFESACFEPGSVVGWWPTTAVSSYIEHPAETHYIDVGPGWEADEVLQAHSMQQLLQRLESQHLMLVIGMTTKACDRIELIPRRVGESKTQWARRIGCTREYLSKQAL